MTHLTDKIKRLNKDVNNAKTRSALNDVDKRVNNILSEVKNNSYINKDLKSNMNQHLLKIRDKINKKRK